MNQQEPGRSYRVQSLGQLFCAQQLCSLLGTGVDRQDPALGFSGLAIGMFPLFGKF